MRILITSISDRAQVLQILLWFVAYIHNEGNAFFQWEVNKRYNPPPIMECLSSLHGPMVT